MVKFCYICKQLKENDNEISIHRLPRKEKLKKKWFKFFGHKVHKNCEICNVHFTESDFTYRKYGFGTKRILKPGSYPSILPGIKNTRKFTSTKDSDDALAVTEDNTDSRISIILGNKIEEAMSIDETAFVDIKKEIENDSIYPELNMNPKRDPLEDEAEKSINTDKTIINANSINNKLERNTDDSLALENHDIQRNIGNQEDLFLVESWCASESFSKRRKAMEETMLEMERYLYTIRQMCEKTEIFYCILGQKGSLMAQHKEQQDPPDSVAALPGFNVVNPPPPVQHLAHPGYVFPQADAPVGYTLISAQQPKLSSLSERRRRYRKRRRERLRAIKLEGGLPPPPPPPVQHLAHSGYVPPQTDALAGCTLTSAQQPKLRSSLSERRRRYRKRRRERLRTIKQEGGLPPLPPVQHLADLAHPGYMPPQADALAGYTLISAQQPKLSGL